ncbi:MAG: type I 3-dehydroquinate dehydratase [Lachnospiraceae bacterium]
MEHFIKVRNLKLGHGIPKVCVPITSCRAEELVAEIEMAKEQKADLVEWRADYCECKDDPDGMAVVGQKVRNAAQDMPVLFTYRTEDKDDPVDMEAYIELNKAMIKSGLVDIIDIELLMGDEICKELCQLAHQHEVKSIISNHDFEGTPTAEVIISRLEKMQQLGADVPKQAVMPQTAKDVVTLLAATEEYARAKAAGPFITMSMKRLGNISRISGEIFGSALTFGSIKKASAPGQLEVKTLQFILQALHDA